MSIARDIAKASTLREEMDRRREAGDPFNMRQIVAMTVPLITELAEQHGEGKRLFVHPAVVVFNPAGLTMSAAAATQAPDEQRDRACLAPEQRASTSQGDASASVFALGAMLYEMITGMSVGPGMQRPSDVRKGIPERFVLLLGKALVTNAQAPSCGSRSAGPGSAQLLAPWRRSHRRRPTRRCSMPTTTSKSMCRCRCCHRRQRMLAQPALRQASPWRPPPRRASPVQVRGRCPSAGGPASKTTPPSWRCSRHPSKPTRAHATW